MKSGLARLNPVGVFTPWTPGWAGLSCGMKRILVSLVLGLLLMNVTSGCNKSADTTTTPAASDQPSTNAVVTNATTTNAPATH